MNSTIPYDEKLFTENIKLIHKVIKDLKIYWSTEDEHQEYYDAGLEGLIKGAKKYDYSTKPGTYLYKCIKNEILHQIVLSETNKRKINKENMLSLEQEVNYDNDTTFGELIASDYDLEEEVEKKLKIEGIIKELGKMKNQKDALAIKMYFGLEGRTPKNYNEIAEEFGVSRNMIYVRINRTLKRLEKRKSFLERNVIMQEKIIENQHGEIVSLVEKKDTNKPILEQVNNILLEQLLSLKKLDLNDKEYSKMQIAKSNAIASTSKIILQSIGIQMMAEKQKYKFLEYK